MDNYKKRIKKNNIIEDQKIKYILKNENKFKKLVRLYKLCPRNIDFI